MAAATATATATAAAGAAEKEASQQSSLGAFSPVDYMSITSFPRLPEEDPPAAPDSCLRARRDEDAFLGGEQDTGLITCNKDIRSVIGLTFPVFYCMLERGLIF